MSLGPHWALRHTVIFFFKIKKSKIKTRNWVTRFSALFSAKSSDTCWSGEAFKLQLKVILQLAEKVLAFGVECNRSGVGVWCETFINIISGGLGVAPRLKQILFSLLADSQTFAGVR